MNTFMLVIFMVLNFGISWFNAWSVGRSWTETKMAGGVPHFMAWCGAIMSACGFTWVYLVIIGGGLNYFHYLNDKWTSAFFSAGYLVIILPILGSGLAMTIESWRVFWQNKTFLNGGVTAWNTYAQISNTYDAIRFIPEAIGNIASAFKDDDESEDAKGTAFRIALIALIFALLGGILTTRSILLASARSTSARRVEAYRQDGSMSPA